MKRLQNFIHGAAYLGLLIGFYLEKKFEEQILGKEAHLAWRVFLPFLVLLVFAKIFEWGTGTAVERWSWMRKIISGDSYIEGVWFNKVLTEKPLYGLLLIEFKEGTISLDGEQLDSNAKLTATWHSSMAKFDGKILTYAYEVDYAGKEQPHMIHGVSEISFSRVTVPGPPTNYNGHFQDIAADHKNCPFTGFRVERPNWWSRMWNRHGEDILEKLKDNKPEAVKALIARCEQS